MEFCGLLEEQKAGMGVNHVLNQRNKVLRDQIVPGGLREERNELGGVVVAALAQPPPRLGQLDQADGLHLLPARRQEHRTLPVQRIAARLEYLTQLLCSDTAVLVCRESF